MSTKLYEYIQYVFQRLMDDEIGRSVAITSLSATTIVSNNLLVGGLGSQKFAQKYAWRPLTAQSADRQRYIDSYTSSTGTLTHSGTNYADTTATSEYALISRYEADFLCQAVHQAIRLLRRLDWTHVACIQGATRYWIGDLDWIKDPDDIVEIRWVPAPIVSRNRYFEKTNGVDTSGLPTFDWWTLSGASATASKSTTQNRRTTNSVKLTRAGADAALTQTIPLLHTGVSNEGLLGEDLTFAVWAWASAASRVTATIADGTQTVTATHTGSSLWEELAPTLTVSNSATALTVACNVVTGDTSGYFDEAYVTYGTTTNDAVRKDNYQWEKVLRADQNGGYGWDFNDQSSTLSFNTPGLGSRGQFIICSKRPYPGFDATRLAAGTADQDTSDAPVEAVVAGTIWRLFESHKDSRAEEWRVNFEELALKHLNLPAPNINDRIRMNRLAPAARRFG